MPAASIRRPDGPQGRPSPRRRSGTRGDAGGREGPEGRRDGVRSLFRPRPLSVRRAALPGDGRRVAGRRLRLLQSRGRDRARSRRHARGDSPERRDCGRRSRLRFAFRVGPVRERTSDETVSERAAQDPRRIQAGLGSRQGRLRHRAREHGGALHPGARLPGAGRHEGARGRQSHHHPERRGAGHPLRIRTLETAERRSRRQEAPRDLRRQVERDRGMQAVPQDLRRNRGGVSEHPEGLRLHRRVPAVAHPLTRVIRCRGHVEPVRRHRDGPRGGPAGRHGDGRGREHRRRARDV